MADVLVTGGTGFIGAPLTRALRERHDVQALSRSDGDVADASTLDRHGRAQHVFHLAGRTYVPDSWAEPAAFMTANVVTTATVLEYCRRVGASLTYVSAYIYGPPEQLPVSETMIPRPNNPYALTKYLAEQTCEFFARYAGVPVTIVRPFNVYGPRQDARFLIPTIIAQVDRGGPIRMKDLTPRRDYLHVDDLVDLLMKTVAPPAGCRIVNAGSGSSISVGALVALVQELAGTTFPVESLGERRSEELDDVVADIRRAAAWFDWRPKTPLREGLQRLMSAARTAA